MPIIIVGVLIIIYFNLKTTLSDGKCCHNNIIKYNY